MTHETSLRLPARLSGVLPIVGKKSGEPEPPPSPTTADSTATLEAELKAQRTALDGAIQSLIAATRVLHEARAQMLAQMERNAIDLAIAIVERFFHRRIDRNEFPIADLVRHALDQLDTKQPLTLVLHPQDLRTVQDHWTQSAGGRALTDVRLVGDPTMPRGNCKVRGGDVSVSLDWQQRLMDLREQLHETTPNLERSDHRSS